MQLETQKYLRSKGGDPVWAVSTLANALSIKVTFHSNEPLVILNYNHIDSPKLHPIVRECRGLTLELGTWQIVARALSRFFNAGECLDEERLFDWSIFSCQEKLDGSLMLMYWYNGAWRTNTRGSFADGEINPKTPIGKTWSELFFQAINKPYLKQLDKGCTYVFEFCSPYNKIIRRYDDIMLYLLTVIVNNEPYELISSECHAIASGLKVLRPRTYDLNSFGDIRRWLASIDDATFEGVVVRDKHCRRLKIKNSRYVELHRIRGEHGDLFNPKRLMPFLLSDKPSDLKQLLEVFPETLPAVNQCNAVLEAAKLKLLSVWREAKQIVSQKEFALYVLQRTQLHSILFEARKHGQDPEKIWKDSGEFLYKTLFLK